MTESHFRKSKTFANNNNPDFNNKCKEEKKQINPIESGEHQSSIQNSQKNEFKIRRSVTKNESNKNINFNRDKLNVDDYIKHQRSSNANNEENKEENSFVESEISHYDGHNYMSDSNNSIDKNQESNTHGFKLVRNNFFLNFFLFFSFLFLFL